MSVRVCLAVATLAALTVLRLAIPARAQESRPEGVAGESRDLNRLLDVLSTWPWVEEERRAEVEKAVEEAVQELARMGDPVIDPLMVEFQQAGDVRDFRERIVRVLHAIKSVKARRVLLDIALGRTAPVRENVRLAAARAWLATADNKQDAAALLVSRETGILADALATLHKQPLDGRAWEQVKQLSASKDPLLLAEAMSVLAEDSDPAHTSGNVETILATAAKAERVPGAGEQVTWEGIYTTKEGLYLRCIRALARMPNADVVLEERMPNLPANERYCVVLARADRGDTTVSEEVRKILTDSDAGIMRVWAAKRLGYIGSDEDIVLLKETAKSDPIERLRGRFYFNLAHEKFFPVREAAEGAIRRLSYGRKAAEGGMKQLRAEEDSIWEAVLRYQFEHNPDVPTFHPGVFFLSVNPCEDPFVLAEDPSDEFMGRF